MKALDAVHFNGLFVLLLKRVDFVFLKAKPKGVTTQMKGLDEYILMALFVVLLKRDHFLVSKT